MTTRDIRLSTDSDLAGSYAAMQRVGKSVIDLAIQTNTAIITMVDGKVVRITANELIKHREAAANAGGCLMSLPVDESF